VIVFLDAAQPFALEEAHGLEHNLPRALVRIIAIGGIGIEQDHTNSP
jgi:hypothetical protein